MSTSGAASGLAALPMPLLDHIDIAGQKQATPSNVLIASQTIYISRITNDDSTRYAIVFENRQCAASPVAKADSNAASPEHHPELCRKVVQLDSRYKGGFTAPRSWQTGKWLGDSVSQGYEWIIHRLVVYHVLRLTSRALHTCLQGVACEFFFDMPRGDTTGCAQPRGSWLTAGTQVLGGQETKDPG